jgi:uncharacterized protein (TIGR02145 family)
VFSKKMVSVSDRDKVREQQRQEAKAQQEYKPTPKPEPVAPMQPAPPPQTVQQTTAPVQSVRETKPAPPPQMVQPTPAATTFTDSRDGKVYKKVAMGAQVWMGENLNYAAGGSKCYENKSSNCEKYGRLYDWETANKACPAGFHLPTDAEWTVLENSVGGGSTAGTRLKSSTGWKRWSKIQIGTNVYGFSALPGGNGSSDGDFSYAGSYGFWWGATELDANYAWIRGMYYNDGNVGRGNDDKTNLYSVRCVAD